MGADLGGLGALSGEPVLQLVDGVVIDGFVECGGHQMSQLASKESGKSEVVGTSRDVGVQGLLTQRVDVSEQQFR